MIASMYSMRREEVEEEDLDLGRELRTGEGGCDCDYVFLVEVVLFTDSGPAEACSPKLVIGWMRRGEGCHDALSHAAENPGSERESHAHGGWVSEHLTRGNFFTCEEPFKVFIPFCTLLYSEMDET